MSLPPQQVLTAGKQHGVTSTAENSAIQAAAAYEHTGFSTQGKTSDWTSRQHNFVSPTSHPVLVNLITALVRRSAFTCLQSLRAHHYSISSAVAVNTVR